MSYVSEQGAFEPSASESKESQSSSYPCPASKIKSLSHGQLRKMRIILCLVDALPSEVFVHNLFRDTLVIQMRFLPNLETTSLARNGL